MSVSLTDHQWAAVKKAADWYAEADRNRDTFSVIDPTDRHLGRGQDFFFGGYAGTGKAQPLDATIQTPHGPMKMGNVRVGDEVLGADGRPTEVTGVFPQGVKPAFRVTFRDGTSTTCCADHLWNVASPKQASFDKYKTVPLQEIMDSGVRYPSGSMRFRVPLAAPVEFHWDRPFLDPYLVGALLGDGYLTGNTPCITIGDHEAEMVSIVRDRLPDGVSMETFTSGAGCRQYRLVFRDAEHDNPLTRALDVLGIRVSGGEKFIPVRHMRAPVNDRVEILRGLMDTDGSVCGNRTSFSTSSHRLAEDVCELVRSLGGVAIHKTYERTARSTVEHHVNVKTLFNPFRLRRKARNWSPSSKNPPSKYISGVEYIGHVEQQCIQVAAADGLYLTDDYIVTHNTTVLPAVIEKMGLYPEEVAFVAPTGKAAKVMGEKLRAFGVNVSPTTIHKLIYLPKAAKADAVQAKLTAVKNAIVAAKAGEDIANVELQDLTLAQLHSREKTLLLDLERAMDSDGPTFSLRAFEEIKEGIKLFVVDEASMVGQDIANDLALFGRPILAFGDPGQLPPVKDKHGFSVNDPDAFLTEIHRQAAENPIIRLATLARQGEPLPLGDYGNDVKVVERRYDDVTLNMDRDAMVLVGTHRKRWALTEKIRKSLGYTETGPMAGEPLIVTKNSRDKKRPWMVNGLIVECMTDTGDLQQANTRLHLEVMPEDMSTSERLIAAQAIFEEHVFRKVNAYSSAPSDAFRAKKECEHLDWAHAITVHKSQGSQWDDVVVHDESQVFRDQARNWLYTAITRSAEHLTVVV